MISFSIFCALTFQVEAPDDVGADKLSDDFEPGKVSAAAEGEGYDHVVVGSDLGGDFCCGSSLCAPRTGFALKV